jgi:hypothetical protein
MQISNNIPVAHPQVECERKSIAWEVATIVLLMAFYLWDILNDACLVFRYHYAGYKYYCCITLIFLVVPGMFMSFLSNDWYAKDEEEFAPVSKSKWKSVFRVVCRIILIWPLARYFRKF